MRFLIANAKVTAGLNERARPMSGRARRAMCEDFVQFCISCFALSGVIAVVGTVTTVGTFSAQSSRTDFAISIASGPPVG